ncbi:MAG TPA: PAS domain S-box protein, partial [Magnetospirillum sp.]|nr:PAS domain S-box protein [Magnetospirillum sp.]
ALRTEHAFRKAMEDSLTVGMRARDLEGRITYVNSAFCRMVGWAADELVGCVPPMPYWSPDAMDLTMEWHNRVMAGNAPPDGFEIQFRRRDGKKFWALIYEAPLIDADGRQSGWMASVLDITERKHAEDMERRQQEKLQRTGRLITMGEMASTLAHELNQPLSAIASYNTGCLNRLASGRFDAGELQTALVKLGVQAQRAGQIIRRVHDFVRKSEPQVQPCAVNAVIDDVVGFIEFDAKSRGVTIQTALAPQNPMVIADRILLEQVVLNLARNGIEAMASIPAPRRKLSVDVRLDDGQVVVSVADWGPGIPDEVAADLFQPFFTTKAEGMGMGLNICRSIIEFHQGRLWFEPNDGGGAVFRFSLPKRSS